MIEEIISLEILFILLREPDSIVSPFNAFAKIQSTLSISPYKNSDWINEIGYRLAEGGQVKFLYSNFKKEEGYKNSIKMSIELNLYRQHYCGCIFSKKHKQFSCPFLSFF